MPRGEASTDTVRVWDLFVRLFHWSLVVTFFVAYVTEDEVMALHVWAAYAVGGLVLMRIVWGFVGTKHARFSDFFFGPLAALGYLRALSAFRAPRHLGHSPAGGFMVFLLLAGCVAIVASGLATYGAEGHGPLNGYVQGDRALPSFAAVGMAWADEKEHEGRKGRDGDGAGEFYEEVHETLANLVLVLVILHIAGVLLASLAHQENLVRSMVTGRKRPR